MLWSRQAPASSNTATALRLAARRVQTTTISRAANAARDFFVFKSKPNIFRFVVRITNPPSYFARSPDRAPRVLTASESWIGLENALVSGNVTGLQSNGTMSLSNTSIFFNTTGITGATTSFGNNRIFGGAAGTASTVGAPTTDHGQQ
jgi:hypothetical protein